VKSKSSDMVRLPNDMIESIKKLNELFRSGQPDEVMQGLHTLVSALEKREAIATYNSIDAKLGAIVERLNQLEQHPPATAPIVPQSEPKPSAVAAATPAPKASAPNLPAPTVKIRYDHDRAPEHSFSTPDGEITLIRGEWREVSLSAMPMIKAEVQKTAANWLFCGGALKLEVAG
jgi:hypothetical protein